MTNNNKDLDLLEELSRQISEIIINKDFDLIAKIDESRQLIIKSFSDNRPIDDVFRKKLKSLINDNNSLILELESQIKRLTKEHNQFDNRFKFYNLTK
jgi:hypothetical protein